MFILTKVSSPSWEESRGSIEDIHSLLDLCICGQCKVNTFEEMKKSFEGNEHIESFTNEDIQTELDYCCISEDYAILSTTEQVGELLSTACGCEFILEDTGNER